MKTLFLANNVYGKHGGPYQPGTALGLLFHLLSRRRTRGAGVLRARDRRHGRDHAGDGGAPPAASAPHIRTGAPVARVDVRGGPRARCRARGRHRDPGAPRCSRTPTRSGRSSACWEAAALPAEFREAVRGDPDGRPVREGEPRAHRGAARRGHAAGLRRRASARCSRWCRRWSSPSAATKPPGAASCPTSSGWTAWSPRTWIRRWRRRAST